MLEEVDRAIAVFSWTTIEARSSAAAASWRTRMRSQCSWSRSNVRILVKAASTALSTSDLLCSLEGATIAFFRREAIHFMAMPRTWSRNDSESCRISSEPLNDTMRAAISANVAHAVELSQFSSTFFSELESCFSSFVQNCVSKTISCPLLSHDQMGARSDSESAKSGSEYRILKSSRWEWQAG